jgi:hypothetical protein
MRIRRRSSLNPQYLRSVPQVRWQIELSIQLQLGLPPSVANLTR